MLVRSVEATRTWRTNVPALMTVSLLLDLTALVVSTTFELAENVVFRAECVLFLGVRHAFGALIACRVDSLLGCTACDI